MTSLVKIITNPRQKTRLTEYIPRKRINTSMALEGMGWCVRLLIFIKQVLQHLIYQNTSNGYDSYNLRSLWSPIRAIVCTSWEPHRNQTARIDFTNHKTKIPTSAPAMYLTMMQILKTTNKYIQEKNSRFGKSRSSWSYGRTVSSISSYNYLCNQYVCNEFEFRSGEVYLIQHYVIMVVSDLRQVGDFLPIYGFPPPIKLTATIYLKYCWKWR